MENTALAKTENNVYGMTKEEEQEFADVPPSLPRMKFNGQNGKFIFSLDQEEKKELRVAILGHRYSNVLFNQPFGSTPSWICRANDALHATLNPEATEAQTAGITGQCDTCPKIRWTEVAPPCNHGLNLLVVDMDELIPYVVTASRTSLRGWENYLNMFRLKRERPFGCVTKVTTEKKTDGKNLTWFVMKPAREEQLEPNTVAELYSMKQSLVGCFANTVEDPIEVAAEAVEDAGEPIEDLPF